MPAALIFPFFAWGIPVKTDLQLKKAGFIVPNKSSKRRIGSFAASVDEVERLTGYDFFSELEDKLENRLEKTNDLKMWDKEFVPSRRSKKLLRKTLN